MPFGGLLTVGLISAGTGLIGAGMSSSAAGHAADIQADATNHAADLQSQASKDALAEQKRQFDIGSAMQRQVYDKTQANTQPWISAGRSALDKMTSKMGMQSPTAQMNATNNMSQLKSWANRGTIDGKGIFSQWKGGGLPPTSGTGSGSGGPSNNPPVQPPLGSGAGTPPATPPVTPSTTPPVTPSTTPPDLTGENVVTQWGWSKQKDGSWVNTNGDKGHWSDNGQFINDTQQKVFDPKTGKLSALGQTTLITADNTPPPQSGPSGTYTLNPVTGQLEKQGSTNPPTPTLTPTAPPPATAGKIVPVGQVMSYPNGTPALSGPYGNVYASSGPTGASANGAAGAPQSTASPFSAGVQFNPSLSYRSVMLPNGQPGVEATGGTLYDVNGNRQTQLE